MLQKTSPTVDYTQIVHNITNKNGLAEYTRQYCLVFTIIIAAFNNFVNMLPTYSYADEVVHLVTFLFTPLWSVIDFDYKNYL